MLQLDSDLMLQLDSDGGWKHSGKQRAGIDLAIEQLEAKIEAQELTEKRGAEVLEVEPARGRRACVLRRRKGAGIDNARSLMLSLK